MKKLHNNNHTEVLITHTSDLNALYTVWIKLLKERKKICLVQTKTADKIWRITTNENISSKKNVLRFVLNVATLMHF